MTKSLVSTLKRLLLRLYHVIRREPAERELSREICSHLALLEERYRAQGLEPDEARAPRAGHSAALNTSRNSTATRGRSCG